MGIEGAEVVMGGVASALRLDSFTLLSVVEFVRYACALRLLDLTGHVEWNDRSVRGGKKRPLA